MSISEFSTVMKARASLKNLNDTTETLASWTDALQNSLTVPTDISKEKAKLGVTSSLMIQDTVNPNDPKARGISNFRNRAMALSHNETVVTEEGLRRHWKFYNLKMPVITETGVTKGRGKYDNTPLLKAYITWYNKNYKKRNKSTLELFSNTGTTDNVEEATGVKYSDTYTNTASVMKQFLKACGLSAEELKKYSENFEVGHIESQAFIRLKSTYQAGEFYNGNFIEKMIKLHEMLDLASSSLLPEYQALTASVLKGTENRGNLFVAVEMQLKGQDERKSKSKYAGIGNVNTNQGSGALSRALGFVAILRDIGSKENLVNPKDKMAVRHIGQEAEVVAVKLQQIYKNYKENIKEVRKALYSSFPNNKKEIAAFLVDLKSSKTLRQHIKEVQLAALRKTTVKPFIAKINPTPVKSFNSTIAQGKKLEKDIETAGRKIKSSLSKLKAVKTKKPAAVGPALMLTADPEQSQVNLPELLLSINSQLQWQIRDNMGDGDRDDLLNYRTGRFASSATVTRLSESRQGMITAFYSYMKYPYATFSSGPPVGRQSYPKSREPKLLISTSIRQIAQQTVGNRLRAVAL
jgi:hypothetical protein